MIYLFIYLFCSFIFCTLHKVFRVFNWCCKIPAFPLRPNTAKYIRRFYGRITGNQLLVHYPLFIQAPVNIFRNQAQYGRNGYLLFWSYSPSTLLRYFRVMSVNHLLISNNVLQGGVGKINDTWTGSQMQGILPVNNRWLTHVLSGRSTNINALRLRRRALIFRDLPSNNMC